MRNIVQISAVPAGLSPRAVYALCGDHTVWVASGENSKWSQLAPIPQPQFADPARPCMSCVHRRDLGDRSHCAEPRDRGTDPVSGARLTPTVLCKDERAPGGDCGPEGKFWVQP